MGQSPAYHHRLRPPAHGGAMRPPYAMIFAELAKAAGLTPGVITVQGQELLPLHPEHCIYRGRLSRRGGWRMLPGGVKCARPGKWGNPHRVSDRQTPADCVHLYDVSVLAYGRAMGTDAAYLAPLVARHRANGYLILYCWCALDAPCHCHPLGDALVKELERIVK